MAYAAAELYLFGLRFIRITCIYVRRILLFYLDGRASMIARIPSKSVITVGVTRKPGVLETVLRGLDQLAALVTGKWGRGPKEATRNQRQCI